jgi:hypothetical protein
MRNLTAVAYNIAQGSIAAYYPEANVLVALDHYDAKSGTRPTNRFRFCSARRQTMKYCAARSRPQSSTRSTLYETHYAEFMRADLWLNNPNLCARSADRT